MKIYCTIYYLLFFLALPLRLSAQQSTLNAESSQITFQVKMTTHFVVPKDSKDISEIRVYHALLTTRPWNTEAKGLGASDVWMMPDFGTIRFDKEHDAHLIRWRQQEDIIPGAHFEFESQWTVRSQARHFSPAQHKLSWPTNHTPPQNLHPELAKLAEAIKSEYDPASAIIQFSQWIRKNIIYDANVGYPTSDMQSIVTNRRGHCGHRLAVFRQLCGQVGIPVRSVKGLMLKTPDGVTDRLRKIRADFANNHAWAEVFFPEVGWVEVEPSYGARAFDIPALFVQNNKWFQNYIIYIQENGVSKRHTWDHEDGRFQSKYGVQNIIDFSVLNTTP
jgi:transglutaminase/protease-like cytokinesis protein 3